ncbi:MAG: hypothetical protein GX335_09740 [Firmicutes bacterium]|nr:hypothetical protein [Bacillota bacterium]
MVRDQLRREIGRFLGLGRKNSTPDYQIIEKQRCEGYTRFLISYQGSENDPIPAYLLVPDRDGVLPGVLIHHQHNGERHLGKSEVCGLAGDPLQAFGAELAKRGLVVLAPDSICFEDRRANRQGIIAAEESDFLQHYNEMCCRILKGSSLMKKVIDDANLGFNLLAKHPKADQRRTGILGHSYGGNTVIFQMALNEEIAFGCSSGAACSYKQKMQAGTGIEMAEVIPGFYQKYDLADLIKCIAPRPLLVVSAAEDKYSADAEQIVAQARPTFSNLNAAANLMHRRYGGGHALTAERFANIVEWIVQITDPV